MTGTLIGRYILVVEDEYFIATDIKRLLQQAGAIVVGPVGNIHAGLSLADEPIDAAVLDVNLGRSLSYPIADRLHGRDVPYMFLTGYDSWSLPAAYREVMCLPKPFPPQAMLAMVGQLIPDKKERA